MGQITRYILGFGFSSYTMSEAFRQPENSDSSFIIFQIGTGIKNNYNASKSNINIPAYKL